MAVSGIVFVGFVLTHMYGNLKAFAGHDAFNEYAHHLRTFGEPMLPYEGLLWVIRVGLIAALVVHVAAGTGGLEGIFIRDLNEQVSQFLNARTASATALLGTSRITSRLTSPFSVPDGRSSRFWNVARDASVPFLAASALIQPRGYWMWVCCGRLR